MINSDVLFFFDGKPAVLPLYEAFAKRILTEIGDVTVKAQKTQISFSNRHNFAFVSLLSVRKGKRQTGDLHHRELRLAIQKRIAPH